MTDVADIADTVAAIAADLNESDETPVHQIDLLVRALGADRVRALVTEAQQLHNQQPLLTRDGTRQRTIGGVFFYLSRAAVRVADHRRIWPDQAWPKPATPQRRPKRRRRHSPIAALLPLTWDQRHSFYAQLGPQRGEARTVKLTLIGRPGDVVEHGQVVVTVMKTSRLPSLPKGMPLPPAEVSYSVYIARKHWAKVEPTLRASQDLLVIEGFAAPDPAIGGIAVFATSVTLRSVPQERAVPQG